MKEYGFHFGKCGPDAHWNVDAAKGFVITGQGVIDTFENENDYARRTMYDPHNLGPWFQARSFTEAAFAMQVETIVIPEGITEIRRLAFWPFKHLKTVVLPYSLTALSDSAFHPERTTVVVPQGSVAQEITAAQPWKARIVMEKPVCCDRCGKIVPAEEGRTLGPFHFCDRCYHPASASKAEAVRLYELITLAEDYDSKVSVALDIRNGGAYFVCIDKVQWDGVFRAFSTLQPIDYTEICRFAADERLEKINRDNWKNYVPRGRLVVAQVDWALNQYASNQHSGMIYLVDNGDMSRYHEIVALHWDATGWWLTEDVLTPEQQYQKQTSLRDLDADNLADWLTDFYEKRT